MAGLFRVCGFRVAGSKGLMLNGVRGAGFFGSSGA